MFWDESFRRKLQRLWNRGADGHEYDHHAASVHSHPASHGGDRACVGSKGV